MFIQKSGEMGIKYPLSLVFFFYRLETNKRVMHIACFCGWKNRNKVKMIKTGRNVVKKQVVVKNLFFYNKTTKRRCE